MEGKGARKGRREGGKGYVGRKERVRIEYERGKRRMKGPRKGMKEERGKKQRMGGRRKGVGQQ